MTILPEQDFSLEKTGTNSYQCKDHSRKKREERDGVTYRAKARKRRKKRRRPRPRQQPRRKLSRGSCFVASRKYFFDEAMRTRNFFGGLQEGGRNCMANPLLKSIAPINLVCLTFEPSSGVTATRTYRLLGLGIEITRRHFPPVDQDTTRVASLCIL